MHWIPQMIIRKWDEWKNSNFEKNSNKSTRSFWSPIKWEFPEMISMRFQKIEKTGEKLNDWNTEPIAKSDLFPKFRALNPIRVHSWLVYMWIFRCQLLHFGIVLRIKRTNTQAQTKTKTCCKKRVESRSETWKWTWCMFVNAKFTAKRAIKFSAWCSLSGHGVRCKN